jgi:hypothetical protein
VPTAADVCTKCPDGLQKATTFYDVIGSGGALKETASECMKQCPPFGQLITEECICGHGTRGWVPLEKREVASDKDFRKKKCNQGTGELEDVSLPA